MLNAMAMIVNWMTRDKKGMRMSSSLTFVWSLINLKKLDFAENKLTKPQLVKMTKKALNHLKRSAVDGQSKDNKQAQNIFRG